MFRATALTTAIEPSPTHSECFPHPIKTLQIAYPAHTGWDFTTGLGSVNVKNLVNNWP